MKKTEEIRKAKERRAEMLREAERESLTQAELGDRQNPKLTASRIGQILRQARKEREAKRSAKSKRAQSAR